MASSAISLLVTGICVLLFTGEHHVAMGGGTGRTREAELPWGLSAKETVPARRKGVKGASTWLALARRELAVRLGGATKGSTPVKGPAEGAVHPDDAAALLKAAAQWKKDSNTVDKRKLLATWDLKRPCSQWFGITCDSATHRVTAIKLPALGGSNPFFNLWGPFPAELGSLPELRSLILARNNLGLNNPFPKGWAHLAKLSHLDLSQNLGFQDEDGGISVPRTLGNLSSLTYLNMADTNRYKLPKELKGLKRLAWLDLSSIPLVTEDVKIVVSLSSLETLYIRGAFLGADVSRLSELGGLTLLDLSENPISDILEGSHSFLRGLTDLEDLRLSSITDASGGLVPAWLGSLHQLTSLDLTDNVFYGPLPTDLRNVSKLGRLLLGGNTLTDTVPTTLSDSSTLTYLSLYGNSFNLSGTTFGPHASSTLKQLDLSGNSLSGSVSAGLSVLTSLESLSLSANALTGPVPEFLWTIPTLTRLDLSQNSLTGIAFSTQSQQMKVGKLKVLDLSSNNLQGSIPKGWSAFKNLTAVSLANNKLTGSIPQELGSLKGLGFLSLSNNQLTGSITDAMVRPSLRLRVAKNQLSGNLPVNALRLEALRLRAITTKDTPSGLLDVSGNYFTGPCYNRLVASLDCYKSGGSTASCSSDVTYELRFLQGNCLQGCDKVPYGDPPPKQRSSAQCASFCGADRAIGPCDGHGSCILKGPKTTPTCTCNKGFSVPASDPGSCVPTPN